MYLMTCTRPDLAYPLSILACYVAPGRHRPEHMAAAKRVLRYLCSTSGLGLVLGGRRPVVLTGHADASWADDQATQRSSQGYTFSLGSGSVSWRSTRSSSVLGSSCEAEIYAGAMAAQELRWLTYLLTDLGEQPRSPPVLYVDNKAMLALCREHRLEHRTKHIAFRYFLARELQQRGQLRLAYVASQANTADILTKALPPGDHQRFCTMLACFALLDWSCFPTCTQLISSSIIPVSSHHWREFDRCLHYLAKTRDAALEFGSGPESLFLVGYANADDDGDKQNRTSTGGYVFVFGGAAVSSSSQSIKCTMLSSTESEYVAAMEAGKEARRLCFLLPEFCLLDARKPTVLHVENQSAITVAEGLGLKGDLKHMERLYASLQQMVKRGKIALQYIPASEQPADFLTKALRFRLSTGAPSKSAKCFWPTLQWG
ncbi:unnamed protein product [Closterium sp. NIES-53]